jgi:protein-disulfide isomerase
MKQKTVFLVAVAVLGVLFFAGAAAYRSHQADQATAAAASNTQLLVRSHSPSLGRADAPVHIVEFFDPACETCAAMYPQVKKLMAADRESIRLSIRYAPFHRGSEDVVKALEASRRQGRFWQALEALVASQGAWVHNHQARIELAWPHLARAGLDMDRLKADMALPEVAQAIEQDLFDAQALKVTMTPEFFVNGRGLPTFGLEPLRDLVGEALAAARKNPG